MSNIVEYNSGNCPPHVTMGKHSYCYGEFRGSGNKVVIGDFCSIAQNTVFDCGFNHDPNMVSTFPFQNRFPGCGAKSNIKIKGDIVIGNDVTIGEGCFIMSGVAIADGAQIGANSVVTKSVFYYEKVAGSPAKTLGNRLPWCYVQKLLQIKWWEWPIEKVLANAHLLNGEHEDIINFINKHYER
jgi:lipopolysaccharide transport system ATP-binding protein